MLTAMTEINTWSGRRVAWLAGFDRRWQARSLLVLILLVAVALRVAGTRFGFPLLLHPDEWAVVDGVIDMAKRNSFEPPWSFRPDHVEMKIDYFLFAGYAVVFKHVSIEAAFAQDPIPFYWIARLATAAFGVATVALAYLIGRRTSIRLGLVMAALFAIFPAFVQNAHFATPDVPLTFSLMLLTYALMCYVRSTSWSSLLWACFADALGIAIKYPAAVGAVMIGIVIVAVAVRDKAWRRLIVHGASSFGALLGFLFVISPTLFTNVSGVRHDLKVQAAGDRLGHPDLGLFGNLTFYSKAYLDHAGIVLLLLGIVGLVLVIRRRQLDRLPWFVGVLVWVALSKLPMTWDRWGLPMWITPLLLAAVAVVYLFEQFRSARTVWIPYGVTAVVGVNLVTSSAMMDAGRTAADTRSAALHYAEDQGIDPANSIYDGYSPFLPGAPWLFFEQVEKVAGGYEFHTKQGRPAEYVILSSGMYGRVFADKSMVENQAIYRWVFQHGKLVAQFAPMANPKVSSLEPIAIADNLRFVRNALEGGLSGPVIKIYRLPQTSS
jgi:4-amino-4-deoxy-L-arabinose transferase-like glycosyltransferase